jgi:preprotein translocase subunit YajC
MKFAKIISLVSSLLVSASLWADQVTGSTDSTLQVSGAAAQPQGAPAWVNLVLIAGIMLFMWLFVFRPQAKRAKEQKEFLTSLTPGQEVVTSGGMIGTITEVKENIVSLSIGQNATIRVLKSAVSGKLNATAEPAK